MAASYQPLATFPAQRTLSALARYIVIYALPLVAGIPVVLLFSKGNLKATLLFAVLGAAYLAFNVYMFTRMRYQIYPNHFVFRFGGRRLVYPWTKVRRVWREDRSTPELRSQFPRSRAVDTLVLEIDAGDGKTRMLDATPNDCAGMLQAVRKAAPLVQTGKPR